MHASSSSAAPSTVHACTPPRPARPPPPLQVRPNSVYIDFGAWVGPTALFASSYAKAVYAMEPDPGAYYELHWNVKMNPSIASKAETAQLCISDAAGVLEMHGELGSSMSTLLEYPGADDHRKNNNTNYADFKVECMTLQTFLDNKGINIGDVGLIKMDTEGACGGARAHVDARWRRGALRRARGRRAAQQPCGPVARSDGARARGKHC